MNTVKTLAAPATKPTNGANSTDKLQATPPPPVKIETQKKEEEPTAPLEDRLHRLNVLFDLQKKYSKLAETKKKLEGFCIAQNMEDSELTISDDDGNEFTTTNPVVIAEVRKLVLNIISEKTKEMATQLHW